MHKQCGAALVVSLVLLVVALLLGLSGAQSSRLEEAMAGNQRAMLLAHKAAEKGVSEGYEKILEPVNPSSFLPLANKFYYWQDVVKDSNWKVVSSCGPDGVQGFYRCAYSLAHVSSANVYGKSEGYYVLGIGVSQDGKGVVLAESPILFARLEKPFYINSALTVLGGILNIESNKWYPTSANAKISNGGSEAINSVYYEGEPNACEASEDTQACYQELAGKEVFEGDVVYSGKTGNSSLRIGELYASASASVNLVTSQEELKLIKKSEECLPENSQFAILDEFEMSGNNKFCGVMIVLGGTVNIPVDVTIGGTASVEGILVAANFEKTEGGYDFEKIGSVDLAINGGGENGSIYFDEDLVSEAFLKVGLSYASYFNNSGKDAVLKRLASWQEG